MTRNIIGLILTAWALVAWMTADRAEYSGAYDTIAWFTVAAFIGYAVAHFGIANVYAIADYVQDRRR